jgi:hypothetical protein
MAPIDLLYQEILGATADTEDEDSVANVILVMGRVITAIEPLSVFSLKVFLC